MMRLPVFIRKIICRFKGHDFGDVFYLSPSVLMFCSRCGTEIMGRTFEDLEPMTDEDRENMASFDDLFETEDWEMANSYQVQRDDLTDQEYQYLSDNLFPLLLRLGKLTRKRKYVIENMIIPQDSSVSPGGLTPP